ncbi:unnamed protein product [Arctogadus glacialis]
MLSGQQVDCITVLSGQQVDSIRMLKARVGNVTPTAGDRRSSRAHVGGSWPTLGWVSLHTVILCCTGFNQQAHALTHAYKAAQQYSVPGRESKTSMSDHDQ